MGDGSASRYALQCAPVSKRYNGITAQGDFRLTVARGEIHALVGQNGSGKSTLYGRAVELAAEECTVEGISRRSLSGDGVPAA
jgi:ABC-type branched-subunit amino acid transport system ATPase component